MDRSGGISSREVNKYGQAVASDSLSGTEIADRILVELKTKGKTYILPVNDDTAMEAVGKPFKLLLDIGQVLKSLSNAA